MKKSKAIAIISCLICIFFIKYNIVFADSICDKYESHNGEICNYETSSSGKASCRCLYNMEKNSAKNCDKGYKNNVSSICEASFSVTNNFTEESVNDKKQNSYVASVSSGLYYNIDCFEGTYISKGKVKINNTTTNKSTTVIGCLYRSDLTPKVTCDKGEPAKIKVTTTKGEKVMGDFYICYKKVSNEKDDSVVLTGDNGPRLEYGNMCESEGFKTASKIAGTIILITKWLAPLILIIVGMIDFGKAILSGNDKSLGDATAVFIKRIVIAIIVPIVPGLLFSLIDFFVGDEVADTKIEFGSCTECLKDPLNCVIEYK